MGEMYSDTCTTGEVVVQIKARLSKKGNERRGWT